MPKLDGLSMACEIRRINPSVPIIATTAFEQSDYLIRSIELGIDRYIVKPINSEVLESALLACAHRLLAEELLRVKEQLEAEAIQNRHHAAMHILLAGVAHDYNNLLQTIFAGVDTAWHYAEPGSKVHRALNLTKTGSAEIRSLSRRLNTLANASDERSARLSRNLCKGPWCVLNSTFRGRPPRFNTMP
jgi:YesN/AraC family two-component response regulator